MIEIHPIQQQKCILGEGSYWDHKRSTLWSVDIKSQLIFSYEPETQEHKKFHFGQQVSCAIPRKSGGLMLTSETGFHYFDPKSGHTEPLFDPESHIKSNRFNDAGVDRQGRLWAGTMCTDKTNLRKSASIYQYNSAKIVLKGPGSFYTVNGIAFSPDGKTMYVSDTNANVQQIWSFEYDIDDGIPFNPRPFFNTKRFTGRPDGAAVDSAGCYWTAAIGGWALIRITPKGKIDMMLTLPVEKPSKPAFGGKNLDTLFVTTISENCCRESSQPLAGHTLAITGLGVSGLVDQYVDV